MLIVLKQTVLASLFDSILNVIASINVVASIVGWFFDMSWAGWLFGMAVPCGLRVVLELYVCSVIRNLQKYLSTSLSGCNLLYRTMFGYVVFKYISYCFGVWWLEKYWSRKKYIYIFFEKDIIKVLLLLLYHFSYWLRLYYQT